MKLTKLEHSGTYDYAIDDELHRIYTTLKDLKELHTKLGHLLQDLEVGDESD